MKFILVIILAGSGQAPSVATAEFDDKDACESARVLMIPAVQERANVLVNSRCFPKSSAPAGAPKK